MKKQAGNMNNSTYSYQLVSILRHSYRYYDENFLTKYEFCLATVSFAYLWINLKEVAFKIVLRGIFSFQ